MSSKRFKTEEEILPLNEINLDDYNQMNTRYNALMQEYNILEENRLKPIREEIKKVLAELKQIKVALMNFDSENGSYAEYENLKNQKKLLEEKYKILSENKNENSQMSEELKELHDYFELQKKRNLERENILREEQTQREKFLREEENRKLSVPVTYEEIMKRHNEHYGDNTTPSLPTSSLPTLEPGVLNSNPFLVHYKPQDNPFFFKKAGKKRKSTKKRKTKKLRRSRRRRYRKYY